MNDISSLQILYSVVEKVESVHHIIVDLIYADILDDYSGPLDLIRSSMRILVPRIPHVKVNLNSFKVLSEVVRCHIDF